MALLQELRHGLRVSSARSLNSYWVFDPIVSFASPRRPLFPRQIGQQLCGLPVVS